jgi:hypothetical protein
MDASAFQYRTHRSTRDNTGTWCSRTQHHNASCGFARHWVRDRSLDPWNLEKASLGFFNALSNRGGDFLGLAVTNTHVAIAVSDYDKCGEAKATTTLDHLGNPVDRDYALKELRLLLAWATILAIPTLASACSARRFRHCYLFPIETLEGETAFASALSEGSNATVVLVATAVKDHRVNPGFLGAGRQFITHLAGFCSLVTISAPKATFHG